MYDLNPTVELQHYLNAQYQDEYGNLGILIVPGAEFGSFTVTLLDDEGDIVRVDEVTNAREEEEGFFFNSHTAYHNGHYEMAKETVRIFLADNMELTYKDYSFHYSGASSSEPAKVYLGIGSIYLSLNFSTYYVEEEGYQTEVGSLSNPKFLGIQGFYNPKASVGLSHKYGSSTKVTYKPEGINDLTSRNLSIVTDITVTNYVTGYSNYIRFGENDPRKPLFHAIALYFGLEDAVRFFYLF